MVSYLKTYLIDKFYTIFELIVINLKFRQQTFRTPNRIC